ncbi:MAG: transposase [Anaerolineae bacterium]
MSPLERKHFEDLVRQLFDRDLKAYRHSLPKGQRESLFRARHAFLKGREELTTNERMELCALLLEHRGTMLERQYQLKEDIRAVLNSRCVAEADARIAMLLREREAFVGTALEGALELLKQKYGEMAAELPLEKQSLFSAT